MQRGEMRNFAVIIVDLNMWLWYDIFVGVVGGLPIFPMKGRAVMSLVGHKVRHRSWGEGIVESHAETFMSVRFMSTDEGEITKKFIFPDALVRGFLVGVDAESVAAIEKTIGDLKCSACGAQNVRTIEVDGER